MLENSTIAQIQALFEFESLAGGKTMWDIGCIVASVLFFIVAIGYAMGCDRLGTKETHR
jgi:hypothetical protein